MRNVRGSEANDFRASDHLGRLALGQRGERLVRGEKTTSRGPHGAGTLTDPAPADDVVSDGDSLDPSDGDATSGRRQVAKLAKSGAHQAKTVAANDDDAQATGEDVVRAGVTKINRRATHEGRKSVGRVGRSVGRRYGSRPGRRADGKAGTSLVRKQRASKAVRTGIIGKQRNKAATRGGKSAIGKLVGASANTAKIAAGRAATVIASAVRAAIAAILSALTSSPTMLVAVAVIGLCMAIVVIIGWLIPGVTSQTGPGGPIETGGWQLIDDYPFKSSPYNTLNRQTGYYFGNCTDFVAWRVNRDAGVTADEMRLGKVKYQWAQLTPHGGNGGQWGNAGNLPGWKSTLAPVPGDIVSIHRAGVLGASAASPGHVGYVGAVGADGSVTIENYGHNKYFLTKTTINQLDAYVRAGALIMKHNPQGRAGGPDPGPGKGQNGDAKKYAQEVLADPMQFQCLNELWMHESGWNVTASNASSGAYGIPQALPGSKMATMGKDWRTNGITQVKWGLLYISQRYSNPCTAWVTWQGRNPHWY